MKFNCRKEDIQEALQTVERAISRKHTPLPVLTGIHMEAKADGTVIVQASDYDLSIRTHFLALFLQIIYMWSLEVLLFFYLYLQI